MKIRKFIALLSLLVGIGLMAYSGNQVMKAGQVYREGAENYSALRGSVKVSAAPGSPGQITQADAGTKVYIPESDIDFVALKALNKDAAAWLYCPDTEIDYPVMRADDYSYYLSHLPDGSYNPNGALFIDFNNAPDFSEPLTVIYGHHMKSGQMFGSIVGYKEQGYYDKHPYMYLYTEKGNYRIDLIYGCVIGAGQWRDRAFMYKDNLSSLMAYAEYNTTFKSGAEYKNGDRIIALSTCSYEFDNARYVVLGVLR